MYLPPKRLKKNSRVAIVAPASSFSSDELVAGLDVISECGLIPVLGPCVKEFKTWLSHSASVQDRVDELNWAFSDPKISAVIAVKGGEGSAALLPYLDYEMIRNSRRVFLGKSDLSALGNGILKKAGLITVNGKSVSIHTDRGQAAIEQECESLKCTLELLMTDAIWGSKPFQKNQFLPRTVSRGIAKGFAIGGNCDTFTRLLGTDYFPNIDNAILFLEDVHKGAENLSRQFLHLKLSGVLDKVKGIVLGEFSKVPKKEGDKGPSVDDVISEYFSKGPPCSYGYSFSHGNLVCPIPIGSECTLDADNGIVRFNFQMASSSYY